MKNRKAFSNYRSGGITVAYKSEIAKFITNIETDSKYVKWLNIDKQLLNFTDKGDAILGVVYIPPENSAYCIGDPYSEIENEYQMFSATFKNICLLGDFNSRTSTDPDFVCLHEYDDNDEFS